MIPTSNFFTLRLFLGVDLTSSQLEFLNRINPLLRNCFVKTIPDTVYLTQIEIEDKTYLGKYIATPFPVKELDSLEKNIISLIRKVLPQDFISLKELHLIPLSTNE